MDIITAATTLRQQLVSLQTSDNNIRSIEQRLQKQGVDFLRAELANNQFRRLQISVRLSVYEGMLRTYSEFSSRKWSQVQSLARSIKSSLESGDNESMTSSMAPSLAGLNISSDKSASTWCEADLERYRRD